MNTALPRSVARRVWIVLVPGMLMLALAPHVSGQGAQGPSMTATANRAPDPLVFANSLLRDRKYDLAADEYERFLKGNPTGIDAVNARFGLAHARLYLLQYQEARRQFETFLRLAPDHPDAAAAWFRIGETSYMLSDLPGARAALERYTAAYPGHRFLDMAWPYLGDVSFALKDLPAARTAYERAINDFPEGRLIDRTRYGLARTLAGQGEAAPALALLETLAAKGGPEWTDKARFQIGEVQALAGRDDDQEGRPDQAKTRFQAAIDAYEALERDAPRSPLAAEAQLHRAEVLLKLDRRDDGEAVLRTLAAKARANIAAQAAYALGGSLLERGKAAEALAVWDDALTRFAGSPVAPMLLYRSAQALELERRPDEARIRYKKLAGEAPKDLWADDALLRAATLALDGGDLAETRTLAARLVSQYPKSGLVPEARVLDARAALAEGKAKEAIQGLSNVLALDPPAAPETAWSARYYLGLAYRADGQRDKSVVILDELSKSSAAPMAASARFVLGQAHFEAKRYADAIAPLESYLAAGPVDPAVATALAYLVLAHHHLGQNEAAARALDRLATEFPGSQPLTRTRYNLAEDALAEKDFSKAADLFRLAAEAAEPADRVKALSGLGWSLLQAKQPGDAADAFAELLKADPDGLLAPDAALARAHALDAAGDAEAALQAYEHVVEKYAKADQSGPALLARARLLVRLKRPADAADGFKQYLDAHPEAGEGPDASDALRIEWGGALLDAEKPSDAVEVFNQVLTDHPDGPHADEARLNLANLAFNAGEFAKVAPLLAPLVADDSKADPTLIPFALFRMAQTRVEQEEWTAAAALFARIVADHPKFPYVQDARFWSAEADYQGGDAGRAEPLFAAYIADPPSGPEAVEWVLTARLRQLQCLVMLARWRDALTAADSLKADAPEFSQAAEVDYARGRALQMQGRLDDALQAYQAVVDAPAKSSDLAARAQWMRGEVYFHQKDYQAAVREFLKVDYLHKHASIWRAAALLEAGKSYEHLDRWSDAVQAYEKLLVEFPDDKTAEDAGKRLEAARDRVAKAGDGGSAR